jgi:hypothetical protein
MDDGRFGGERAVPRGDAPGRISREAPPVRQGRNGFGDDGSSRPDGVVAGGSRPRSGNVVTGQAVPRGSVPSAQRPVTIYYRSYYSGYYPGIWSYPYWYGSFGLGYFYYDPYWWSYPSYSSWYGGYGGGGYGYGGGSRSSYYSGYGFDTGAIRLKVKPEHAQVLVDGYFVGTVDNFDGVFQRLRLDPGPHRIEIRAPGYESLAFDVRIVPGETINYRAELRPLP